MPTRASEVRADRRCQAGERRMLLLVCKNSTIEQFDPSADVSWLIKSVREHSVSAHNRHCAKRDQRDDQASGANKPRQAEVRRLLSRTNVEYETASSRRSACPARKPCSVGWQAV